MPYSRFIFDNAPCDYSHNSYFLLAYNSDYKASIVFDTVRDTKLCFDNRLTNECLYIELTKAQIAHFLSLDCADAFIAYALTLSSFPFEKITVELTAAEIRTIICGLQWSINHHKSLPDSAFCDEYERKEIFQKIQSLKLSFMKHKDNY